MGHSRTSDSPGALRLRKWRAANPERQKAYQTAYYAANTEKFKAYQKAWYDRNGHKTLVKGAEQRAKRKGLPFDLPDDWKANVTQCEWCALPFVKRHPIFAASIDRIRPELGYIESNCRLILMGLNTFKSTGDDQTVLAVAKALVEHNL